MRLNTKLTNPPLLPPSPPLLNPTHLSIHFCQFHCHSPSLCVDCRLPSANAGSPSIAVAPTDLLLHTCSFRLLARTPRHISPSNDRNGYHQDVVITERSPGSSAQQSSDRRSRSFKNWHRAQARANCQHSSCRKHQHIRPSSTCRRRVPIPIHPPRCRTFASPALRPLRLEAASRLRRE